MSLTLRAPGQIRGFGVALLVVMCVGTFGANRDPSPPGPVWLGALLAVGAVVPVLVELPAAASLAACGGLTAAYFASGYADGPVFLGIPIVVLVVGSTSRPHWDWAAVAAALGVVGLVARRVVHHVDRPVAWQCIGLIALTAAAAAVSAAIRSRRMAAAELARSVASAEQVRMAADLHDGVGHGLALIAMQAGAALHVLDRDPTAVRANLEAIRDTSRESLDLLRGQLDRLAGDSAAPRTPMQGLADLPALVDRVRASGLDVRLDITGDAVPDRVGRAAYAVVQEGLTNVLRHAGAGRADVSVETVATELVATVVDDGHGPAAGAVDGRGIGGMRSRVVELGGSLDAGPGTTGFRVRAVIPLGEER